MMGHRDIRAVVLRLIETGVIQSHTYAERWFSMEETMRATGYWSPTAPTVWDLANGSHIAFRPRDPGKSVLPKMILLLGRD